MIEIVKLLKPSVLKKNADQWLYELLHDDEISVYKQNRYRHEEIKQILKEETHGKCVYCESCLIHISFGDIEHILPKSKFPNLTYDWSNLTLSCTICNIYKNNYYDPNDRLLNPYIDHVEEHLQLTPIILAKTKSGMKTIEILKLNRSELIDRRNEKVSEINNLFLIYKTEDDVFLKELYKKNLLDKFVVEEEYFGMINSVFKERVNELLRVKSY